MPRSPRPRGPSRPSFGRLRGPDRAQQHFSVSKAQIERAQNVVTQALSELSLDCEYVEEGRALYDAQHVLGLFSGPAGEATEEIVEMMDNTFAELVPGAGRRKGTYPGRTSDTISVTAIVANIGEGKAMDRIEWFYREAANMMNTSKDRREGRGRRWDDISKLSDVLPNL